jgi:hypothetical protein
MVEFTKTILWGVLVGAVAASGTCGGCADAPNVACACCGAPAMVASVAPATPYEPAHAISWCAGCWAVLLACRAQRARRKAAPLEAGALTPAGKRLLRGPTPARQRLPATWTAWLAQQRQRTTGTTAGQVSP